MQQGSMEPDISSFSAVREDRQLQKILNTVQWNNNTLVGCLRSRNQLKVCRTHNFYHLPADRLECDPASISYVAIYQSRHFFGIWGGIRYYGKVTGFRTVPRREISQIPKDSDDLYIQFCVESWNRLRRPVAIRDIPITHLITSDSLLKSSRETGQLLLSSPDELQLYSALHKELRWPKGRFGTHGFRIGHCAVVSSKGRIYVLRDEKMHYICTMKELSENRLETFQRIFSKVNQA